MTIITLTSDFGDADGYVGVMKGVILGIAPAARLVDLSHEIAPQAIRQAAYVLGQAAPHFPPGTIHLAVVDPGVGGARRPLLVTTPAASFIGPDNGLFTFALALAGAQAWRLDRPAFWLPAVGRTFHGRDIFAPVAAHLANGVHPADLGSPIADALRLPDAGPERRSTGVIGGHIIHVDHFGNLISNIPGAWVVAGGWCVELRGREIARLSQTYADVPIGSLLALISSGGTVEIAVRDGNAAAHLGVGVGEPVILRPAN